jgi:DNA-binding MarR family transcriptional regulator
MKYPNARLTPKQVKAIRAACKAGDYGIQSELARKYGVTPGSINAIHKRRTWKKVTK